MCQKQKLFCQTRTTVTTVDVVKKGKENCFIRVLFAGSKKLVEKDSSQTVTVVSEFTGRF